MTKRIRTMAIVSTALSLALLSGFAMTKTPVAYGNVVICHNDQTANSTAHAGRDSNALLRLSGQHTSRRTMAANGQPEVGRAQDGCGTNPVHAGAARADEDKVPLHNPGNVRKGTSPSGSALFS
jgi:hypothetical protein